MRRLLICVAVAVVAAGGATAAWAETSADRGPKRAAVRACVAQARAADPDADRAALRKAVKSCLEERRAQFRECYRQTPDHRDAIRQCMSE